MISYLEIVITYLDSPKQRFLALRLPERLTQHLQLDLCLLCVVVPGHFQCFSYPRVMLCVCCATVQHGGVVLVFIH